MKGKNEKNEGKRKNGRKTLARETKRKEKVKVRKRYRNESELN